MTLVLRRLAEGIACLGIVAGFAAAVFAQNQGFPQNQGPGSPPAAGQPAGPQGYGPQAGPQGPQQIGPQQGPAGPQQARPQQGPVVANPAAPRVPLAPFQLTPPQEQYLNEILTYWEYKSRAIKRFRTKFVRLEYDPVFGPKDPETPNTESNGQIVYSAPDKGLFKVEKITHYVAPKAPGEQPRYEAHQDEVGEHWVCDGKSVFEYNHQQKKLVQYELPPAMQGQAIANSPLPFVFGANAAQIKQRFWMRVITPREAKGQYWLEAYPKEQADAANYQKIEIILDEKEYLPQAIQVFDPTYDVHRNPKRTTFIFDEREANWNDTLERLNPLHKEFYEPAVPGGWTKEVQRFNQEAQAGPPQQARAVSANGRR